MQIEKNSIQLSYSADYFYIIKNDDSGFFSDQFLYYSAAQSKFLFSFIKKSVTWIFPIKHNLQQHYHQLYQNSES